MTDNNKAVLWIDKFDVVTRQIKESVWLFFEERDPVVIHTIIASAHQILFDIGRGKGIISAVKNTEKLRGKEVQEMIKNINYPYNFFKHADNDPEGKINIGPLGQLVADFIMDAIIMLQNSCEHLPIEAKIYWMWFVSKYKEQFDNFPAGSFSQKMQDMNLGEMDFPTICQFLKFSNIVTPNMTDGT